MLTQAYIWGGSRCRCAMSNIIANIPNYYKRAALFEPHETYITVKADTQVRIGDGGYISSEDVDLQLDDCLSASSRAGVDLYVYACQPEDEKSTEPVFVLSQNSTVPDGYDADSSRKIGGFHCECSAVGTISGHDISGLPTGGIIPNSVWDLLHRASCENEGMEWESSIGAWVDVYQPSWDGSQLVSAYGGAVVTGTTATPMHGEKLVEYLGKVGKRLLTRDEFVVVAKGSNEGTNIDGSANPTTAGGHVDTAGRRMISNGGLEDCCGAWWQWVQDCYGAFNSVASSTYSASVGQLGGGNTSGNHYLQGFAWDETVNSNEYNRAEHPDIDGSENYGGWHGVLARARVGAYWVDGSHCGSRSAALNSLPSRVNSSIGARGAAGPRAVGTL